MQSNPTLYGLLREQIASGLSAKPTFEDIPYLDADPVRWIHDHFHIPETNAAIRLEPYQQRVITEALRRDESGAFVYSTVLYSDLKKSAKSTIAAAVVLWLIWQRPWETARIVGNDLKQADSRTFYYIRRALELNRKLGDLCSIKLYNIDLPNKSHIQAIPVDPKGEAGGGDLVTCFTELWAYKNAAAKQLWTETTLSPLKFGQSIRWCESYAGYEGESPILEQLYTEGVRGGKPLDSDLPMFANGRLFAFWNETPRCYWQTPEYYAEEARILTDSEFQRIHRNQWQRAVSHFVPIEWWDACAVSDYAESGKLAVTVGMDAAVSGDCFAIVVTGRKNGLIQTRDVYLWTPPKDGKIIYSNPHDPNDLSTPEGVIRDLAQRYHVYEVAYDPYQLHDFASRLNAEGVVFLNPFEQGKARIIADKQLYDLIRDRNIQHRNHPDLNTHMNNAARKEEGEKLRIVKGTDETRKIDAVVALSMAAARAIYYGLG